jgi:hypothetical protein
MPAVRKTLRLLRLVPRLRLGTRASSVLCPEKKSRGGFETRPYHLREAEPPRMRSEAEPRNEKKSI